MIAALGSGTCPYTCLSASSRVSVTRIAVKVRASVSASPGNSSSASRRTAVLSGLALVGLVLPLPKPGLAQTPEVSAQPSKKFVETVLQDPELRKRLGKWLRAPAQYLRNKQRADNGLMLLAPIRGSRARLKEADFKLSKVNVYDPNPRIFREALGTIRMASMNCYEFEPTDSDTFETKVSALQAQLKLGDACTFRLIAKNVTNLLPAEERDLRQETNDSLTELLNAFQLLDDMVDRASEGDAHAMERIGDCIQFAIAHTATFEHNIQKCLGLPLSVI
ncbi:hypothetical protein WJX74_004019 [Apatococcus lobatus]|uniref:Uncharacterized protein n=1 Tax=Apatococcus lobatus TaxID=904363 RepID=A0AAW1SB85_9CHLO